MVRSGLCSVTRWLRPLALLALAMLVWLSPGAMRPVQAAPVPTMRDTYILRFGDALNILVVGNPDLTISRQAIRPDGMITVPLVGEMRAGGATVTQFQNALTKAISRYIVGPQVVVNVAYFRPLQITLLGMVNEPGAYTVAEPVTLLQAIALASGINHERADTTRVEVLRPTGDLRVINLDKVQHGDVEDNVMVGDGDTITVDEVNYPDFYRLVGPVTSVIAVISTLLLVIGTHL